MRIQLLFITVLFLALQAFAEIAEFRDPPEHCDDCHRGVWLAFKSFETENQEDNDLKYNAHFFSLGGFGISDSRTDIYVFAYGGVMPFENKRLSFEHYFLGSYKRSFSGSDKSAYSVSSLVAGSGLLLIQQIIDFSGPVSSVGRGLIGAMWAFSGSTVFNLWGSNVGGISLVESHSIDWWIFEGNPDEDNIPRYGSPGLTEEFCIRLNVPFLGLANAGIRFEFSTLGAESSLFAKFIFLHIPYESSREHGSQKCFSWRHK